MRGECANHLLTSIREASILLVKSRSAAECIMRQSRDYDIDSHHCAKILSNVIGIVESLEDFLAVVEMNDRDWCIHKARVQAGLELPDPPSLTDVEKAATGKKEDSNGKDNNCGEGRSELYSP